MSLKTVLTADEAYLDKLAETDEVALVTVIDEEFSLNHIRIFNLKPALKGIIPETAKVVTYDFGVPELKKIDEEIAEGIVFNIKMLMSGHIDGLNLLNLKTIDYCDMAEVDEISLDGNEYLHWEDGDMQVLIDHFILLGAQKKPHSKLN